MCIKPLLFSTQKYVCIMVLYFTNKFLHMYVAKCTDVYHFNSVATRILKLCLKTCIRAMVVINIHAQSFPINDPLFNTISLA